MKNPEAKYLDKRTAQRNIKLGFLKEDELEKHLKSLPDEAENALPVSYEALDAAELVVEDDLDDEEDLEEEPEPTPDSAA